MLPTQEPTVAAHAPDPPTAHRNLDDQRSTDHTNPSLYHPFDNTAFHYYPPNINNGIHRSVDPRNIGNETFNLIASSRKSCLHFANKIKDFVTGLVLTGEQRRRAWFKSLSLLEMRGMVQSFGLSTDNNIGMRIASNVARFIQDSRTAKSLRQRVPAV